MIQIVFFFLLFDFVFMDPFETCRNKPTFSTKTGYDMLPKPTNIVQKPSGYKPIQINMVYRHGERFPGMDDVEEMKELASKINKLKNLSSSVNLTLPWNIQFSGKEDKMLAKEGETVLYELGKRIKNRFPGLFTKTYTEYNYKFMSTCKTRTTGSSNSLAFGLFEGSGHLGSGKQQPIHLIVNPCDEDIILKAQDNCKKYAVEVGDNDEALKEVDKYKKGPEVESLIKSLKSKFGDENMSLSYDEVKLMYEVCSWDIIMFNGSLQKGICSMFSSQQLSVIEYGEDIDNYYTRSTGYNISYQPSCVLLKDIYESLEAKVLNMQSDTTEYEAIFRAGHSDTMLPLYALLGVYTNAIEMKADNILLNKNRKFRSGCLDPFSANLYFILYQSNLNASRHRIQLYINERLTKIPGCSSDIYCDFNVFQEQYKKIVNECDFKKLCDVSKVPSSAASLVNLTWWFMFIMLLINEACVYHRYI